MKIFLLNSYFVINIRGGNETRPAEVGDKAIAGHAATHVFVIGDKDALLGEASRIPEILPAERRDDGVLHGEIEPHGQGGVHRTRISPLRV